MILARGTGDDSKLLVLGLSREDVNTLTEGDPIRLTPKTHGDGVPAGWTIALVFGEIEKDVVLQLRGAGLIHPKAGVHVPQKS